MKKYHQMRTLKHVLGVFLSWSSCWSHSAFPSFPLIVSILWLKLLESSPEHSLNITWHSVLPKSHVAPERTQHSRGPFGPVDELIDYAVGWKLILVCITSRKLMIISEVVLVYSQQDMRSDFHSTSGFSLIKNRLFFPFKLNFKVKLLWWLSKEEMNQTGLCDLWRTSVRDSDRREEVERALAGTLSFSGSQGFWTFPWSSRRFKSILFLANNASEGCQIPPYLFRLLNANIQI